MTSAILSAAQETLRQLFSFSPQTKLARKPWPLQFECLENRTVPAVLTVNTTVDNLTSDSVMTLREAILLVDNGGNVNAALGRALTAGEKAQISGVFGSADRIQFAANLNNKTITLDGNQLAITKAVVIDASALQHLTIDGNNASRIFDIDDGNPGSIKVFLIGPLTLTRGSVNGYGGAIYNAENLTVYGVTIEESVASSGGGIYNIGALQLTGSSTVYDNSAGRNNGGGIYNAGSLVADNASFSLNNATSGGAIDNIFPATATIDHSNFSTNWTTGIDGGGAILNTGKLNLYGLNTGYGPSSWFNIFSFNYATNGIGGAVHTMGSGTTSIDGYEFDYNSAQSGGAIFNDTSSTTTIFGGEFDENLVHGGSGGAITNAGLLTLDGGTSIGENYSYGTVGGAIANLAGSASINNASFNGNNTYFGDGAAIYNNATMRINSCSISDNESDNNGGGVANYGVLTILSSTITSNCAGNEGGGIYSSATSVTRLHNTTVNNNCFPNWDESDFFGPYSIY